MSQSCDELREKLSELIEVHQLTHRQDLILEAVKPSIRLFLEPDSYSNNASSHVGGLAKVPESFTWPVRRNGQPLTHMAQINFADLAEFDTGNNLPTSGQLNFFFDLDDYISLGDRHDVTDGWSVIYSAADSLARATLKEIPRISRDQRITNDRERQRERMKNWNVINPNQPFLTPRLEDLVLPVCQLKFEQDLTIPATGSIEQIPLELEPSDMRRYWDLKSHLESLLEGEDPDHSVHRMFGHPDSIQGCMQRTIQFISHGAYLPDEVYDYYEHPRAFELMSGAHDWLLLFQLDSSKNPLWCWGDWGRLFFWIRKQDLASGNFEKAWFLMQCG